MDVGTRVSIHVADEPSFQDRVGVVVSRPARVAVEHEGCDREHIYVDIDATPDAIEAAAMMFHLDDVKLLDPPG